MGLHLLIPPTNGSRTNSLSSPNKSLHPLGRCVFVCVCVFACVCVRERDRKSVCVFVWFCSPPSGLLSFSLSLTLSLTHTHTKMCMLTGGFFFCFAAVFVETLGSLHVFTAQGWGGPSFPGNWRLPPIFVSSHYCLCSFFILEIGSFLLYCLLVLLHMRPHTLFFFVNAHFFKRKLYSTASARRLQDWGGNIVIHLICLLALYYICVLILLFFLIISNGTSPSGLGGFGKLVPSSADDGHSPMFKPP